jgi:endonuclease/exonuclease/phosphatase (EEP) superfamily protein YafD
MSHQRKPVIVWTLTILTALFVVLTLLPLSSSPVWWVRGADFPRLQLVIAGIILGVFTISWCDRSVWTTWVLLGVIACAIVYQAWWIFPYTPLCAKEVKNAVGGAHEDRISVMSVNVLMTNKRSEDLLRMVRKEAPDVLVMLETNAWWESAVSELEKNYPHRLRCPQDNLYGMHMYSRFPLEDSKIQFLVERDVPSMHTLVALPSGRRICLHCVHPAPPSPTENPTSRERDAELVMVGRSVSRARFPVIVSGDLNDVAWSATTRLFRRVSGLLDPRIGRGMFNTFHAGHRFMRWPVDHFFHSKDFTVVRLVRLPGCGSDHFPVLIELKYTPCETGNSEGLKPGSTQHAEAEEKMEKAGASPSSVHRPGEGLAAR